MENPDSVRDASDEELALAFQGGSEAAFDELVRRHQGRVFAIAYRMTGNREDALDVAQDVFVKVHGKIGSWRPTGSFGGWLARVTVNQSIDHVRRVARDRRGSEASLRESAGGSALSADRLAGGKEIEAAVQGALGGLSDSQRTVFVLRHYDGMALSEIGESMGIATGTVKIHLFRALRKLRVELKDLKE